MRRSIEERIRRLEDVLPGLEPKTRLLTKTTWEDDEGIISTAISEGRNMREARTLFSWKPEDPDAAKQEAAYAAFLAGGSFEILHLRVIYTRDEEGRVARLAEDAHRIASEPRCTAPPLPSPSEAVTEARQEPREARSVNVEDDPRAGEGELRAELKRLRERWACLTEGDDEHIH
jgi:hypothetical protein